MLPSPRIDGNRTRCHRCGSPNLYRDYTAAGEVLACLMCGERMEPGRNERHGGVDGHAIAESVTREVRETVTTARKQKTAPKPPAGGSKPVSSPVHADQMNTKGTLATEPKRNLWPLGAKGASAGAESPIAPLKQEKPMTEFIRRCQNCGRDAQLSGPLCVGICYAAAKGKTGEEREKALREAKERVARGEYRGGSHWAGSRKIAARQGRAEAMRLNGFIARMEIPTAWAYYEPDQRTMFILEEHDCLAVRLHEYGHWINACLYFVLEVVWEFFWWGCGLREAFKKKGGWIRR